MMEMEPDPIQETNASEKNIVEELAQDELGSEDEIENLRLFLDIEYCAHESTRKNLKAAVDLLKELDVLTGGDALTDRCDSSTRPPLPNMLANNTALSWANLKSENEKLTAFLVRLKNDLFAMAGTGSVDIEMIESARSKIQDFLNTRTEYRKDWSDFTDDTLYVMRPVLNGEEIHAWARQNGFNSILDPTELHVTIAYSKKTVNWNSFRPIMSKLIVGNAEHRSILKFKDAIVLKIDSPEIVSRWCHFRMLGASWDFPEYCPHVSISYSRNDHLEIDSIDPYRGDIVFGAEEFALLSP